MEGIDVTWLDVEEIEVTEKSLASRVLVFVEVSVCVVCGSVSGEYLKMPFHAAR